MNLFEYKMDHEKETAFKEQLTERELSDFEYEYNNAHRVALEVICKYNQIVSDRLSKKELIRLIKLKSEHLGDKLERQHLNALGDLWIGLIEIEKKYKFLSEAPEKCFPFNHLSVEEREKIYSDRLEYSHYVSDDLNVPECTDTRCILNFKKQEREQHIKDSLNEHRNPDQA